jgi:myosin heavy subunit
VFDQSSNIYGKWEIGETKVFLKEETRAYLEEKLGVLIRQ